MEIQDQTCDIDKLAATIEGADLLQDFTGGVWSCYRRGDDFGWVAVGCGGFAGLNNLRYSDLVVPTIIY